MKFAVLSSFVTFHLDPWNFCFFSREVPGGSQEQRRVRARRFPARGWPAARGNRGERERGSRATFRWSWVERRWSVAAAPRRGADGGGSGRRRSCSGEGMRLRTGRRASGGRVTSVLWVGSCGGRPEMGVHHWADLAGDNGRRRRS